MDPYQPLRYSVGRQTDPERLHEIGQEDGDTMIPIQTELSSDPKLQFGNSLLSDIRVAAHNMRGGLLAPGKELYRTAVCAYIQRERIDVMALLDIGLPIESQNVAKQLWEQQLGPQYRVYIFPSGRPLAKKGSRSHMLIGGQLIICLIDASRYTLRRCFGDELKLGIMVTTIITVTGRSAKLKLLSVYIPSMPADMKFNDESGGLYHKAQVALRKAGGISQDPIAWLTGLIRAKATEGKCKEHRPTLVIGDFNRAPSPCVNDGLVNDGEFEQFIASLGLGKQWTTALQAVNPSVHTYRSGESITFIDHCLHTLQPEELVWGAVDQSWEWANYSDHLPVAMGVRLGHNNRIAYRPETAIRKRRGLMMQFNADGRTSAATKAMLEISLNIELTGVGQLPLYSVNLADAVADAEHATPQSWHSASEVGSMLDNLTGQIVRATYAAYDTSRFTYHESQPRGAKRYWTPVLAAARLHQQFLGQLQIIGRTPIGITTTIMNRLVDRWEHRLVKLNYGQADMPEEQRDHGTGHPPEWWRLAAMEQWSMTTIRTDLALVIKHTHKSERRRAYKAMNQKIERRERNFDSNQLKRVYRSLLQKDNIAWSGDRIELLDGEIIAGMKETHEHVTAHYNRIFAAPSDSLFSKAGLASVDLANVDDLEAAIISADALYQRLEPHLPNSAPRELLRKVVEEWVRPISSEASSEMAAVFDTPPSYRSFLKLIRSANPNKAPGISLLTVGMLKATPVGILYQIYQACVYLWERRTVPDSWKYSLVQLLYKVAGADRMANMRPITLLEVLRKLWTRLLVSRTTAVIRKHQLISDEQHMRPNRECASELIKIEDSLQEARETGCPIWLASFDCTMGFDTIERAQQYMALRRVGMPPKDVLYAILMDVGGAAVIKTNYSMDALVNAQLSGANTEILNRVCRQIGYQTQRSIPQGGPESVQKFELVQDPTLRVLTRQLLQAPFYSRGPDSCLRPARAKGFVDDTIALAATADIMQQAANAVSMGLLVSGMYLNTKKLRLLSSADIAGTMTTYDSQWIGTITPFQGPEAMAKVLGVPLTLDGTTTAAFRYSRDKLRKAVEALGPRRSRIRTKLTTLGRGPHMSTLYVSQHVGFTDEEQTTFNQLSMSIPRRYRYVI